MRQRGHISRLTPSKVLACAHTRWAEAFRCETTVKEQGSLMPRTSRQVGMVAESAPAVSIHDSQAPHRDCQGSASPTLLLGRRTTRTQLPTRAAEAAMQSWLDIFKSEGTPRE